MKNPRTQSPTRPANSPPRDGVPTDEKLILRALQRWEGEGGRILRNVGRASEAPTQGAR